MANKKVGSQTIRFENPPVVCGFSAVVGKKEGEGPLASTFDYINNDTTFGQRSWEKAESMMQQEAFNRAIAKSNIKKEALSCIFGGDLLNQCISTSFAMRDTNIPFFGLYGACSTMAEGIIGAALGIDGGFFDSAAAITSSHFCTAERQYRLPLEYGGQRTPTAQWTATASGAVILSNNGTGAKVTHATIGRIIDMGITDANNMGAAMAPAAYDTLTAFFDDTGLSPDYFDLIVTGDLGKVGKSVLKELFQINARQLGDCYDDCGVMLFDGTQDTHAGGSGCGCSAAVLCGYILDSMQKKLINRVIFAGTGALLSPVSTNQGESIPSVCHLVVIENQ